MPQKQTKRRKIFLTVVLSVLLTVLSGIGIFAYFSNNAFVYTEDGRRLARLGVEVTLLFDRLDEDQIPRDTEINVVLETTQDAEGIFVETRARFDPDAPFGSAQNPFVISEMRHVQNLSVLQNRGYFYNLYISQNFDANNNYAPPAGGAAMPYFLVCKPDGTPVTIDGGSTVIQPIGNDAYPFIGYIGGAWVAGETQTANGMTATTSVLQNMTVRAGSHVVDIGLFGSIRYLGSPTAVEGVINGEPSTLRDLLLYDVLVVAKDNLWEDLADIVHQYSYLLLAENEQAAAVHETHHIGILAGHVECSMVKNISVYYSNADKAALDLLHASKKINGEDANYYSSNGILGYITDMNLLTNSNGQLVVGSGVSNGDLSASLTGGGGLLSGTNPGYVSAGKMYLNYQGQSALPVYINTETNQDVGVKIYREQIAGAYTYTDELERVLEDRGGSFVFLENGVVKNTYTAYFFAEVQENGGELYFDSAENPLGLVRAKDLVLRDAKDSENNSLVTNAGNNKYYYTDGVFTFALSSETDKIAPIWDPKEGNPTGAPSIELSSESEWEYGEISLSGKYNYPIKITPVTAASELSNANDSAGVRYFIGNRRTSETDPFVFLDISNNSVGTYTPPAGEVVREGDSYIFNFSDRAAWNVCYDKRHRIWTPSGQSYPAINWGNYYLKLSRFIFYYLTTGTSADAFGFDYKPEAGVGAFKIAKSTRILYYTGSGFSFTTTDDDNARLMIYRVERLDPVPLDTQTRPGFINQSPAAELPADEFVFWPQSNPAPNATQSAAPTYEAVSIESLGWKNEDGTPLARVDKAFYLSESTQWGLSLNIFGFNLSTNGIVTAPVGSDGTEINIPMSTVAFKVNAPGAKIRVIVAVPCSAAPNLPLGSEGANGSDYYLGIWEIPTTSSWLVTFDATDAANKIELPRSQPLYRSGQTGEDGSSFRAEGLNVAYNGAQYRTYLQGEYYLVAYEFEVPKANTAYLLGMANSDDALNSATPMRIVYFSADGVASSGRDGTGGSAAGSIDFVYDYNGQIVTVDRTDTRTGTDLPEDYQYYYSCGSLLFTDSQKKIDGVYIRVWDEKVFVRRRVDEATYADVPKTALDVTIESSEDSLERQYVTVRQRARENARDHLTLNYRARSN